MFDKRTDSVFWYQQDSSETIARLESNAQTGLSDTQVSERLAAFGPNQLKEGKRRPFILLFARQFTDFMILVLIVAAIVSGLIGDIEDTLAILTILILNALVGAIQEYRAEQAVAALKVMSVPQTRVVREGKVQSISTIDLVPGDIVLLEAGNLIPADMRLVENFDLEVDESALTGESHPVHKIIDPITDPDLPLGDQFNMLFKGSHVTRGRGRGVVTTTGMQTELGRIAGMLALEKSVKTPLQIRMARFGRHLALAVLVICSIVFVSGLLQGQPILLMMLTAISLAVAAIPEALPAVITISLALGAKRLSRHNSLIRNLPAVETLGSVTFICSDKTGTLTENRMQAEAFVAASETRNTLDDTQEKTPWQSLAQALALSNDVSEQAQQMIGDPTEIALFQAAASAGYLKNELERNQPRIAELPFDSRRKLMTTIHNTSTGLIAYIKGAPEIVLEHCIDQLSANDPLPLNHTAILDQAEALANEGFRVIAVAQRQLTDLPDPLTNVETELTLLGLVALIDPPRPEAEAAVNECVRAGITPVMITGDHPGTARAIAQRLGIINDQEAVLTGQELSQLSDEELDQQVLSTRVYARVTPEQKIQIVNALQNNGQFVAMTGDGVNDAPALKHAGIGIAMGKQGTDVARQAADMVLLDDNFATIVKAVREGRHIFDNILKFTKYTMSSNSGEIWTLFLAPLLGLPIPLLPIHILWINLVTDGLPGLAFTMEPEESDVMKRKPRSPDGSIFAHGMWQHIIWVGLFIGAISITSQAWAVGQNLSYWQTIVFTVLTISQLFHSMAVRSERQSLFTIGIFSNLTMLGAVLLTVSLQMAVIYTPFLNPIFNTQPLPLSDLLLCFALSSLTLFAVEIEKWMARHKLIYQAS